jgi:hypothetical protein
MKSLIVVFILILSPLAYSFSCEQNEAQFIGKITSTRIERIDQGVKDCFVKIEFTQFSPNILCPLDISTATSSEIVDFNCDRNFEVDQAVSGILIQKNDILFIEE